MNIMREKLISVILLFAFVANAQQDLKLNLDDSSDGRSISDFYKTLRKHTTYGIGVGYQDVSFFNHTFFDNVDNGTIKNKGGYEVLMFVTMAPVMIDVAYIWSKLDVTANSFYPDFSDKSTGFHGIDAYISYAPLFPDLGKVSEIIIPYAGIGYQSAKLFVKVGDKSGSSSSKESKTIASYGVSSPMWKGGVRFNLGQFFIKGEYKQGLSLSKPEAMRLISFSVGTKF